MKPLKRLIPCALAALLVGFTGTAAAEEYIDSPEAIAADAAQAQLLADLADLDRYAAIAGISAIWGEELGDADELTAALEGANDLQLLALQNAANVDNVRAILLGKNVPALPDGVIGTEALGSLTQDLVYSPVFPCRIFDTRNTPGTPTNNQVNSYIVHGPVSGQGGNPAGCPAPQGEPVGISINLAAVPVSTVGHLRIYPYLGALPTASFLNYFGGGNIANSGLITTCFLCGPDISVYNRNTAHSFADVMGYFYPARQEIPSQTISSGSTPPAVAACTNVASLSLFPNEEGYWNVTADVRSHISNGGSTYEWIRYYLSTSSTSCTSTYYGLHDSYDTTGHGTVGVSLSTRFYVAKTGGVIYLNALTSGDTGAEHMFTLGEKMHATFYASAF